MHCDIPMGLRFSILHRAFHRQLDRRLCEKDITGVQFWVMGELLRLEQENRGQISQRDLENATHVTHPTMTEILKRLEKKDFIHRETSSLDRRYKSISSTLKAHSLSEEMKQLDKAVFDQLCSDLSPEQTGLLVEITDIMMKNAALCCERGCE